jgi:hypothetical protein
MKLIELHRHSVLLVALLMMALAQPFSKKWLGGLVVYDVVLTFAMLAVYVIVFATYTRRVTALLILVPALAARWIAFGLEGESRTIAIAVHNGGTLLFFGYAVWVILRRIFENRKVGTDQVMGTVCGYLLAGAAWGNFYAMADQIAPHAFSIKPELAWAHEDPHARSFLFNYFSFCTLTSATNGDVTPVGPIVAQFTWLEALFGNFYIAVVVSQLVGLKLATATLHSRAEESPAERS